MWWVFLLYYWSQILGLILADVSGLCSQASVSNQRRADGGRGLQWLHVSRDRRPAQSRHQPQQEVHGGARLCLPAGILLVTSLTPLLRSSPIHQPSFIWPVHHQTLRILTQKTYSCNFSFWEQPFIYCFDIPVSVVCNGLTSLVLKSSSVFKKVAHPLAEDIRGRCRLHVIFGFYIKHYGTWTQISHLPEREDGFPVNWERFMPMNF